MADRAGLPSPESTRNWQDAVRCCVVGCQSTDIGWVQLRIFDGTASYHDG
jgi:hypothetical protein